MLHPDRPLRSVPIRPLRIRSLPALALAVLAVGFAPPAQAQDWLQFRGPNASGIATSSASLPTEFSHEENVRWSAALGDGIASPVISRGRVFATGMPSPKTFKVFSVEAKTGRELWSKEFAVDTLPTVIPPNTHASSTPATDGERVYVYFSTLGLLAFDAQTGKELWRGKVDEPFYLMAWGAASSPIVHGDLVIFNQDDDLRPALYAFDRLTGELRWKKARPDMLAGYALPVLCTANGRTDLVIAGTGKMKGYDPATGEELWTCNTLLLEPRTTPRGAVQAAAARADFSVARRIGHPRSRVILLIGCPAQPRPVW